MQTIADQITYIVICSHTSGPYVRERNVSETDRKTTIADIASGELDDVVQVIAFNPVEHTCDDVTSEIMGEAAFEIIKDTHYDDLNDWQRAFVADYAQGALAAHRNECRAEDAHRRSLMGAA